MKKNKKIIFCLLGLLLFGYVGLFGSSPFISKYWFHPEIRKYLIASKFDQGICLSSSRWGVSPKKVIGYKESKNNSYYLLQDVDRHEHLQYISKLEVDRIGRRISCRI